MTTDHVPDVDVLHPSIEDVVNQHIESYIHDNVDPSYVVVFIESLFYWLKIMHCKYTIDDTDFDVNWVRAKKEFEETFVLEVPQKYDVKLGEECVMGIIDDLKNII